MKRLGMFLVLLSVSMFALGCSQPKQDAPPANPPAPVTGETSAAGETPATPETTPATPPAADPTGAEDK